MSSKKKSKAPKSGQPKTKKRLGKKSASPEKEIERVIRDVTVPDELRATMRKEIPKMKVITPSQVAMKYNLRIGIAKDVLRELELNGRITRILGNRRLSIYVAKAGN
ncbi:MAG: hypothetical protein ACFE7E_03730 [Candidatus Hodarchaeota archaeon]